MEEYFRDMEQFDSNLDTAPTANDPSVNFINQELFCTFVIILDILYIIIPKARMNVTLENYRSLNFDTISVKEEWNMPAERERRMHSIHAFQLNSLHLSQQRQSIKLKNTIYRSKL